MSFDLKKNQKQEVDLTYNFKLIVLCGFCVCEVDARISILKVLAVLVVSCCPGEKGRERKQTNKKNPNPGGGVASFHK